MRGAVFHGGGHDGGGGRPRGIIVHARVFGLEARAKEDSSMREVGQPGDLPLVARVTKCDPHQWALFLSTSVFSVFFCVCCEIKPVAV